MITIQVDEQVFDRLKALAEPFVDTPNTVLRRILELDKPTGAQVTSTHVSPPTKNALPAQGGTKMSSSAFMTLVLKNRYQERFRQVSPYRTMFESDNRLIYFRNFNKLGTGNLWYRLSESAINVLRQSRKNVLVCLTNPAEGFLYEIPIKDIDQRASTRKWDKDHYEVNINPASSRWIDMDWDVHKYLVEHLV